MLVVPDRFRVMLASRSVTKCDTYHPQCLVSPCICRILPSVCRVLLLPTYWMVSRLRSPLRSRKPGRPDSSGTLQWNLGSVIGVSKRCCSVCGYLFNYMSHETGPFVYRRSQRLSVLPSSVAARYCDPHEP